MIDLKLVGIPAVRHCLFTGVDNRDAARIGAVCETGLRFGLWNESGMPCRIVVHGEYTQLYSSTRGEWYRP